MAKLPRQVDSRIAIVTPENIAFEYALAGPMRRLPAFAVDVLIRAMVIVAIVLSMFLFTAIGISGLGFSVLLITWFALSWFYGGLFETLWNGQTPGKWLLGLRVLTVDGEPINALQAVLRNVLRDVDALPFSPVGLGMYMVGLVTMAANDRFQRLGDLACGTIVVIERKGDWHGLAPMSEPAVVELAQTLPTRYVPNRSMSQALAAYVARRKLFSQARRFEIANNLAAPLCEMLSLPADTNPDLLLCALYYRKFIAEAAEMREALIAAERPALAEVTGR